MEKSVKVRTRLPGFSVMSTSPLVVAAWDTNFPARTREGVGVEMGVGVLSAAVGSDPVSTDPVAVQPDTADTTTAPTASNRANFMIPISHVTGWLAPQDHAS